MTDTMGGSEPDPDFDAQFAQLLHEVAQGRPAPAHEPSARARMLQQKWRAQPPPTTPWRGDVPTVGDATVRPSTSPAARLKRRYPGARSWPRNLVIAVIIVALAYAVIATNGR